MPICNYCKSEKSSVIARYTRFEKNNVRQCKNCGLVHLETKKSKEAVEFFYASEYRRIPTLPIQSPGEHFYNKVTQNDANNRVQFISNYIDIKDKRILEIGSASGSLLQKLSECGCKEARGIELDEEFSKYARQWGFKVYIHPIEKLNFKEDFDLVVSFHTLEHMYDPMVVIQAVYAALKPRGRFLGEVPNQNDWRIKIFNDEIVKRFHYHPNHYYYYSPGSLRNYFGVCGFENIHMETVERYNSLMQLKNILLDSPVEETMRKHIFPKTERDEARLPSKDKTEIKFNKMFEIGVNSELMGNCLRWIATKE